METPVNIDVVAIRIVIKHAFNPAVGASAHAESLPVASTIGINLQVFDPGKFCRCREVGSLRWRCARCYSVGGVESRKKRNGGPRNVGNFHDLPACSRSTVASPAAPGTGAIRSNNGH